MGLRMLGFVFIAMVAGKRVETKMGLETQGEKAKAATEAGESTESTQSEKTKVATGVGESKASVALKEEAPARSVVRSLKWWLQPRTPKVPKVARFLQDGRGPARSKVPHPAEVQTAEVQQHALCSAPQQACLQEACQASRDISDANDATFDTIMTEIQGALNLMEANLVSQDVLMLSVPDDKCYDHEHCREISEANLAQMFKFKRFKLKGLHLDPQWDFLHKYMKLPNAMSPISEGEMESYFKMGACNVQTDAMQCRALACV